MLEKEGAGWSRGCWRREVGSVIRKLDSVGSVIRRLKNKDLRHCSTLSPLKSQTENLPLLTVFSPQLISVRSFCYSH